MPYTAKQLRDDLWAWGDAQKHGYWKGAPPADPDTPRLAVHFGPRLPCAADFLDLTRAFAGLNPRLPGTIGDLGWYYATRQFTRPQLVLWLYYVEGFGMRRFRDDWRALSVEARTLLLGLEADHAGKHVVPEDGSGDRVIAAKLGVSVRTVYYDRSGAINRMVRYLNPSKEQREEEVCAA